MEVFSETTSDALRTVVGACQTPIIVLLLASAVFIVGCLGSLLVEYLTEHRRFKVFLPKLVDDLKANAQDPYEVITQSGLLMRQKRYLTELTRHSAIGDNMRESLAVGLVYQEQRRYDGVVKITDLAARIAPMLGLLGTLIPLGPGILALGNGDTETLAGSLLIAFDTTSLGLMIAGVALIISAIRKRWYKDYMVTFNAATECVLEVEAGSTGADGVGGDGGSVDGAPLGESGKEKSW
jgi:biopolymer transport protein ExbB/TolQ